MAKIHHIEPARVLLNDEAAEPKPPKQIEVTVTPNPTTRAQHRENLKAEQLAKATESAATPSKLSSWQKKARRKRKREIHRLAKQDRRNTGK